MAENIELLFFDTFSHESSEELNLDLVQFPKPVFITEVRIIPLGARVQADFPGGVRLGATNPSQFEIEFFVNDLSKPGASTFESLGALEYKQNVNIQLDRLMGVQIPTDGLVLRGWYTTITLAVYGSLTKSIQESVTAPNQSIVPHSVPQKAGSNPRTPESHNSTNSEWGQQKHPQVKDLINSDRNTYIESSNLNQDPYNNNYNNEQFHGGDYSHHNFREDWQQPSRVHHGEGFETNKDSIRWENNGSSNIDGSGDKLSWERSKERDSGGGGPRGGYHSHRTLGRRERGNWDQSRHSWETSQPPPPPPPPRKTASSILPVKVASGAVVEPSRKRPRSPVAAVPSGVLAVAQQQGSSPPKRPYTPPVDPKPPQCDLDVKKETTVNQKFDTLSPGDVESISEGEIPDGEASAAASGAASVTVVKPATPLEISDTFEGTTASSSAGLNTDDHPNTLAYSSPNAKIILPTSSAEAISHDSSNQLQPLPPPEAEQFEPILSDEEILDEVEGQFPDIDYHEYIDEMGKHFNPYTCEFQPIQFFAEFGTKPSIPDAGIRLKELTIGRETTENWLNLAEQAYPLVVCGLSQLNFDQNIIDILISWIGIGLDVEAAANQPQPGYMVRHLKAGIRLSEVMCQCNGEEGQRLVLRLIDKEKLQQRLFMLYRREHMALSIQLMAVSALEASIRTPSAARTLLNEYPQLVNLLESSHLARTKYAWMALLRKLHICEALLRLREAAAALVRNRQRFLQSSSELEAACSCLEEIIRVHKEALYSVAQHRRFLPVTSQFELDTEGLADPYPSLFALYRTECLLESCLVLAASSSSGFAHVFNFLHVLIMESQSRIGLQFLASHPQVSTALVRLLLASGTTTAEELGLAFAYRLQALYHSDQMSELLLKEPTLDPNEGDFFEQLQSLCHLGFGSATGRTHLVHILALDATLEPILYVLKHNPSISVLTPNSENSNTEQESPARLYAADLIVWTLRHSDYVPFLKRYGKELFQLATEANDRLLDALTFLRPLENPASIFHYDDLSPLCEIVKRHVDTSAQLPGELCTALRILNHLCVPINNCTYSEHPDLDLFEEPILSGGESNELKYKYALLHFFSLDGMTLMTNILKRICEAHPQPQMHSVILAGRRGRSLLSIVLPCLQLLRRMLTQVIRCRGSKFRDLTAIPILLDVFALAQAVPLTATHQPKAATACREAITALLAYTQPTLQAAEAPSNSLWTQALAEVFKWTSASPHSFISGLFILSELLPLTLPVITRVELSTREISRAINARLLWSAHLHPLASQIHELIGLLASSSCQPVVQMLRRVCVQLSDLAAPSSLLVMRGVLDAALNATHSCMTPSSNTNSTSSSLCSGHATRLLAFLASLTAHASIKCALVQLVARGGPAKNDEKYMTLIPTLICIIRKAAPESNSHVQAQECALSIIQSLCDSELSLATGTHNNDLQNLANALPPRETLATLCHAVLEHLSEKEHPVATSIAAMRALLVIAEHDYGFQQLRIGLERHHPEALIIPFNKINEHLKDNNNTECLSLLTTSLELVRVCLSLDPDEDHVPRTLTLSVSELAQMLQWSYNANESSEENSAHSQKCPHSILIIEKLLQELLQSTTSNCDQESLESLYENISSLIRLLNEEGQIKSMDQSNNDSFNSIPNLPTPDTLLVQFGMRQVSILTNSSEINDDERLGSAYWLSIPLTEENETESDSDLSQRVPCDLIELSRQLIPEFQLVSETDKMYRLNNDSEGLSTGGSTSGTTPVQTSSLIGVVLGNNGSDPSNQNNSLSTGVDNNKTGRPFVAPMRGRGGGFGRSIPLQRGGDLFRSRPPNTSRPPSLHVDDFVALEITGQQPTGPTGYNKMPSTANLLSRGGQGSNNASLGGVGASGPGGNGPPMVSILGNRNNIGNRGIGQRNSARFFGATSLLSPYNRRHENGRGASRGIGMGLRLGGGRGNNVSSAGLSSTSVSLSNSANVTNASTVSSWPPESLVGSNSTGSGGSGSTAVGNSMAVRELRMITSNTTSARSIGGNIWPLSKGTSGERTVGVPGTTRRDLLPPRHARTFPR